MKILFISRPVDSNIKGTGISAVIFWLRKKLLNSNISLIEVKEIKFIPTYHGIFSIIFYDLLAPFFIVLKNVFTKVNVIFFTDVSQSIAIHLIKILKPNTPIVTLVHNYFDPNNSGTKIYSKYINHITRKALKYSDFIICTAEENKSDIEKTNIKNISSKLIVLPLGMTIEPSKNMPVEILKNKEQIIIGYIGSSHPRKRLDRFFILADQAEKNNIKLKIRMAGNINNDIKNGFKKFKNVEFECLGNIHEDFKAGFYQSLDAIFFPTDIEGFGLPIIEAYFYKKPCIIMKNAKIPKIVRRGCLVVEDDFSNLTIIMENLIELNLDIKKLIEDNFIYSKRFDWSNYVEYFKKFKKGKKIMPKKILVSPCHYVLDIDSRSEFFTAAKTIAGIADKNKDCIYYVICGKCFNVDKIAHKNLFIIEMFPKRKEIKLDIITRISFYFLLTLKTISVVKKEKIDIIWHHLPSGWFSFNPAILFNLDRIFNRRIIRIIGGLQYRDHNNNHLKLENAIIEKGITKNIGFKMIEIKIYSILIKILGLFSKNYFNKFDFFTFNTPSAKDFYANKLKREFTNLNSICIPLGIDTTKFYFNLKEYKEPLRFIYVGNLIERKRVGDVIKICKELELLGLGFTLDIYGDGICENELRGLVKNLDLSKIVQFKGVVKNELMPEIYNRAHILFLLSICESFGLVLLEAWSSGVLFVGSKITTFEEKINNHKNGILLNLVDMKYKECANEIMNLNDNLYKQIVKRAYIDSREYDWNKVIDSYAKIIR